MILIDAPDVIARQTLRVVVLMAVIPDMARLCVDNGQSVVQLVTQIEVAVAIVHGRAYIFHMRLQSL